MVLKEHFGPIYCLLPNINVYGTDFICYISNCKINVKTIEYVVLLIPQHNEFLIISEKHLSITLMNTTRAHIITILKIMFQRILA